MSRNVKDSDDEMETKSGRKTRAALYPSAVDSPLRRSSRIKQTVQPEGSSPESTSDISSVGPTRNTRRRNTTGDAASIEPTRNLRTRRNSATSDISELTETESIADGPTKRSTRRSVVGLSAPETPTKLNGRPRRTTRAGSESKSTPPGARTTRRTRANSLEPEGTEVEKVGSPIKTRRRASVLPSEPAVAEESEDSGNGGRRPVDKTVYEIEEDECVYVDSRSPNTSTSSRRKSKSDANESVEKMEVDESPVRKSEGNTIERSRREITEINNSHVPKKLEESNESSPQRISSSAKGSAYTIERLLSIPMDKQDKSPGNKENKVLNDSVTIIEKTSRSSNIDVRLLSRKSLNSANVKPQEKRHNISVDDTLLSNYCETSTNYPRELSSEIAKNSTDISNRKERYSVDDCVVVIEPMEIDHIDKIIIDKESSSLGTPQQRKIHDNVSNSVTENEEIDGNKSLVNQVSITDNEMNKDNNNETTDLNISNVVSVIVDDKDEEKSDESEVMVELKLQLDDPVAIIEGTTMIEGANNEKVSLESSSLTDKPRISISQDENGKNYDKTAISSSIVIRESEKLINESHSDDLINETALSESLSSNLESIVSSCAINNVKSINCDDIEENLIVAKDRKSSIVTESPTSRANGEEETSIVIEEKSRKSTSSGRSSNANEPKSTSDTIEEKSRKSTSSGRSSNASELKSTSDTIEEKSRKSTSSRRSSNASELKSTSDAIEDKSRKSISSGKSSNTSDIFEEESPKKKITGDEKAHQSDEESEYDGFPTFKDIPADEWTGGTDNEISQRDPDTNSVHSVSTEHNDDECDVVFSNNEIPQIAQPEKEDLSRSEYDSDDTVKNALAPRKSVGRIENEGSVLSQITSMDVSSDGDEKNDIIVSKEIVKRRSNLNNSRKIDDSNNTPLSNKNVSMLNNDSAKNSPIGLNVSKRNLIFNTDDKDNHNVSVIMNNSLSKPLKKRSFNNSASLDADVIPSDNEKLDNGEAMTPKIVNRKSLDGSGKKLKDRTIDTSNTNVSAKNTPKQMENKTNETSLINWSLKKLHQNSDSDNSEGFQNSLASSAINKSAILNISAKSASAKKSKLNTSNSKSEEVSNLIIETSVNPEYASSPEIKLNKSLKLASAKKSKLNTSVSKSFEVLDTLNGTSSESDLCPDTKHKLYKRLMKYGSDKKLAKNNFIVLDSPASPDAGDYVSETLIKYGSAKKSPKNKSPIVDVDSQDNLRRLSASAKKLAISRNCSTIAQVNSDSELDDDIEAESSDNAEVSRKIPKFLFDHSSNSSSSNNEDNDSAGSIDSDVERELNLKGESVIEYSDDDVPADDCMANESESSDDEDDGDDLIDFVVDDDEDEEDNEEESEIDIEEDDKKETHESLKSETKKPRKRIIPRPVKDSDSSESEDEPMNVSSILDKSKTAKTPIKAGDINKSIQIIETNINLNESVKILSAKKNKNLDIQCSTPKTLARLSLLPDNINSSKTATPLNKSLKANDSLKLNVSKKLSKSVCETVETPVKLGTSLKTPKTPKSAVSVEKQLQTSLSKDLSDPILKTNLSKEKSSKITTLNKTLLPAGSESPETRFLMKEKLNDSLPAMKLLKSKALRRSGLENLREKIEVMDEETVTTDDQMQTNETEKRASFGKKITAILPEISSEKKKKTKKRLENLNTSEYVEEVENLFNESIAILDESASSKKSTKLNKKKKAANETEETPVEENSKKKKKNKKKQEEIIPNVVSPVKEKKKKKKKDRKSADSAEPEVSTLKQKTRLNSAPNIAASDSDDEPVAIDFATARDAALKDLRKVTDSLKAAQETKKKKHQELLLLSREDRMTKIRAERVGGIEKIKTSIKRLPDEVLESLSDVAERPTKKRKLAKDDKKIVPSTSIFGSQNPLIANFTVDDGYIPLSSSGGTTQFTVVNLKKVVKHSKKAAAAVSFRERMLARNPRQPVSAYLMYQQKQKASGKDRPY